MKASAFGSLFLLVCSLLSCSTCLASLNTQILDFNNAKIIKVNCPEPRLLTRSPDTQIWSYRKFWKSFDPSLTTRLDTFLGAQWSGSTIGSVICIYSNKQQPDSFPVYITFTGTVRIPSNKAWRQTQSGIKNCISDDVTQCSFETYTPNQKQIDLYEEALNLRANN